MRNHAFAIPSPVQSQPLAVPPPRSICKKVIVTWMRGIRGVEGQAVTQDKKDKRLPQLLPSPGHPDLRQTSQDGPGQ